MSSQRPASSSPRGRGRQRPGPRCVIADQGGPDERGHDFYRRVLGALQQAHVPVLVGGAYAFECYTGIRRRTKDFDLFIHPRDRDRTLAALQAAGFQAEVAFPHWLAKARQGDDFVDIIHSSGNGCAPVDDEWFAHAVDAIVLGVPVRLCPLEEMIWQKALIMERERYDGADVLHLLHAAGEQLDWERLLRRFGAHWRVLLSYLVLYGFVYPFDRNRIPPACVLDELLARLQRERASAPPRRRVCQGTVLSRQQYLPDLEQWGYRDARAAPAGPLCADDIARWTAAIADDGMLR